MSTPHSPGSGGKPSAAWTEMVRRLSEAAERDPRIVGLVDYGSSSEGRLDEWSDVDVAVFVRDEDFDDFSANWKAWAAQFGDLLLAYVGQIGHPWTVFAAEPVPLRVDFDLFRESEVDRFPLWPNSPLSLDAFVWYDATGGRLSEHAGRLVGKSLRPRDQHASFERHCGDFWYYLLFVLAKLDRGQSWVARQAFHTLVMENLFRLLRLQAGALERWRGSPAALDAEQALQPAVLRRLQGCIPGRADADLRAAMQAAASVGGDACADMAARNGWSWPAELGERVVRLLQQRRR